MKKKGVKKEPQTLEQQNAARQLQLDHLRESDKIMFASAARGRNFEGVPHDLMRKEIETRNLQQQKTQLFMFMLLMAVKITAKPKKKTFFQRVIILMSLSTAVIKGKLGFDITEEDGSFVSKSLIIEEAITLNAGGFFIPVWSGLALLGSRITLLQTAITNVGLGIMGSGAAKKKAKKDVMRSLRLGLAYINNLAWDDQTNAVEIIEGAKMVVVNNNTQDKPIIGAKVGLNPGDVRLDAIAAKNAAGNPTKAGYDWQYAKMTSGVLIWIDVDSTLVANTIIPGLTINVEYCFRRQIRTRVARVEVKTGWSDYVTFTPR